MTLLVLHCVTGDRVGRKISYFIIIHPSMGPWTGVAGKTNTSLIFIDYGTVDRGGREN